jgi:hypothetical protein
MRMTRGQAMLVSVLAIGLGSGRAAAQPAAQEAPEAPTVTPAGGGEQVPAQPPPRVATAPAPSGGATAPTWKEGFMIMPSLGLNSFQGNQAENVGIGLRAGLFAGSRLSELVSLNVGFAFDTVNFDSVPGAEASEYMLDIGFNPLFHFPLEKVELLVGPAAGTFLMYGSGSAIGTSFDTWAYGWTIGGNAGVLFPVGKAKLGGLFNLHVRNPMKLCVTANGSDSCQSDNLTAAKALAFSFAAMF